MDRPNEPETIVSKEINSFECEFSHRYYCWFSLVRREDDALCVGRGYRHNQMEFKFEIMVLPSALDALQAVIDE